MPLLATGPETRGVYGFVSTSVEQKFDVIRWHSIEVVAGGSKWRGEHRSHVHVCVVALALAERKGGKFRDEARYSRRMSEDPIELAWTEVEAAWNQPEAHKRFLLVCDSVGRLAEAGRRYRQVKESDPERRAMAEKQIDALLGLAMTRVKADKTEPRKGRSRVEWIGIGLAVVLLSVALIQLMRLAGV